MKYSTVPNPINANVSAANLIIFLNLALIFDLPHAFDVCPALCELCAIH